MVVVVCVFLGGGICGQKEKEMFGQPCVLELIPCALQFQEFKSLNQFHKIILY